MTEIKLLTFGCARCRDERKMCRDWMTYSVSHYGPLAIIPETIRCGWCRRVVEFRL